MTAARPGIGDSHKELLTRPGRPTLLAAEAMLHHHGQVLDTVASSA